MEKIAKMGKKKLLVLASPSGGGKTTIANYVLDNYKTRFSISATTRPLRQGEEDGKHYFFLTKEQFIKHIEAGDLVEYETIFNNYYGTLKTEVEKAINNDEILLFDVDVKGAFSIRKAYPETSLLVFIAPPSMEILEQRLRNRQTESDSDINTRLARAELELSYKEEFDYVIINSDLELAFVQIDELLDKYEIERKK